MLSATLKALPFLCWIEDIPVQYIPRFLYLSNIAYNFNLVTNILQFDLIKLQDKQLIKILIYLAFLQYDY